MRIKPSVGDDGLGEYRPRCRPRSLLLKIWRAAVVLGVEKWHVDHLIHELLRIIAILLSISNFTIELLQFLNLRYRRAETDLRTR